MRLALILAAALAAAAPSAALADPAPPPAPAAPATADDTDVRCMVVSGALSQSEDPQVQSLGRAALFYFAGRLEGRGKGANLGAVVAQAYDEMSSADLQKQMQTCGGLLTAATQTLQDITAAFAQRHPAAAH
jgi:hypothetical protein